MQNVKAFSAPVLAWLESWSGSRLSLSIAGRCSQTTFSIMQMTGVKAMREVTWKLAANVSVWKLSSFSTWSSDTWRTVQKHAASFLVSEQSEQIQCQTRSAAGSIIKCTECGSGEVNTYCRAAQCCFHRMISQCHLWQSSKCRWDKRISTLQICWGEKWILTP